MKKYLLSLAAFCLFSKAAGAAVLISVTSGTSSPTFRTTTSTLIADGSYVRIGTFESEPAADSTFAQLAGLFQEFGTTTSGHTAGAGANKGLLSKTDIAGAAGGQPDSYFVGKSVYIWVYSEAGLDATTSATAQQGVFKSTTGVFVDDPLGFATSVSTSSFRTAYGQVDGVAATTTANAGNTATASFTLAGAIPEPSSSVLFLLVGVLGLVRRR